MKAKEIMQKKVLALDPDMPLSEAGKIFVSQHITGAPVVDADGNLVGVLSQTDLVREGPGEGVGEVSVYQLAREEEFQTYGFQVESSGKTVRDVMTPKVVSCPEDTPVEDLAREMLRKHIHRVLITRRGQLSGIVSSMDMLRALLALTGKHRRPVKA